MQYTYLIFNEMVTDFVSYSPQNHSINFVYRTLSALQFVGLVRKIECFMRKEQTMLPVMSKRRLLYVVLLANAFVMASSMSSSANGCVDYNVAIKNSSQENLQIVGVRVLDQTQSHWTVMPFEKKIVSSGDSWTATINIVDIEDTEVFLQVQFQRMRKGNSQQWGEVENTSDYHIPSMTSGGLTNVKLVDKRS